MATENEEIKLQRATLVDWRNRIYDNDLTLGDRLQGLVSRIDAVLLGEPEGLYPAHVIRESGYRMHIQATSWAIHQNSGEIRHTTDAREADEARMVGFLVENQFPVPQTEAARQAAEQHKPNFPVPKYRWSADGKTVTFENWDEMLAAGLLHRQAAPSDLHAKIMALPVTNAGMMELPAAAAALVDAAPEQSRQEELTDEAAVISAAKLAWPNMPVNWFEKSDGAIRTAIFTFARALLASQPAEPVAATVETVTLTAFQLLEALDFAAPERDSDPVQWETEINFGIVRHQDDNGKDLGYAMCCWNEDTDGVLPLTIDYMNEVIAVRREGAA